MADLKPRIRFHAADRNIPFRKRMILRNFILLILNREGIRCNEINYIFCSDKYLLRINQEFLLHDTYTDVITFHSGGSKIDLQGEIYVSVDRVRENAKTYNVGVSEELYRVIFHGLLHLCGYRDKSSLDKKRMRHQESFYLSQYLSKVSRETRST